MTMWLRHSIIQRKQNLIDLQSSLLTFTSGNQGLETPRPGTIHAWGNSQSFSCKIAMSVNFRFQCCQVQGNCFWFGGASAEVDRRRSMWVHCFFIAVIKHDDAVYRRRSLFGLMLPEAKESIMIGAHDRRWQA